MRYVWGEWEYAFPTPLLLPMLGECMGHASARLDAVLLDAPPPSLRAPMGEGLGALQQFDHLTPTLPLTLTLSLTLTPNP